jgi:hypothetical protein
MLVFNLYLMFGGWLYHLAIFAIGAGLLVAGTFFCFRSPPKRLVGLLMVVGGATAIGVGLNTEYWWFTGEDSIPIVCEVRDRDGAAVSGAGCQVIHADSGEAVGEGVADNLGIARLDARLSLRGSVNWIRTVVSMNSEYVVRASADGFRLKDVPLGFQGYAMDRKPIVVAILLEKAP